MNKESIIREVYETSFKDETQKIAGSTSEAFGSVLGNMLPIVGGPASLVGSIAAAVTPTLTKEEMKRQQKESASNFIPGVGTYRLLKRMGYSHEDLKKQNLKDEMKKSAGVYSEYLGQIVNPLNLVANPIGAIAAGLTDTKSDEEMKKQQKKSVSNFLLPGTAAYRYFKRMGHSNKKMNLENAKDD